MRLAHPEWLPAALAASAAVGLALALATRRARRRLALLLGPRAPRSAGGASDAALALAFVAIAAALLGPSVGERVAMTSSSGVDVVLLVDVSRSMDARDVAPSRLARARQAAESVLARLEPGDRSALAAFAGRGVLLTPLTPDHDALAQMLPSLDGDLMRPRGSRLGEGVRAAVSAFEAGSLRPRVVLVLSDGEDAAPTTADDLGIGEATQAGVRFLAAGFGRTEGAPVPDGDVPLRDASGREVRSRIDLARLARLAEATGGEFLPEDARGGFDAAAAVAAIRRDAGGAPGTPVERRVPARRDAVLAALAFALLALEAAGRAPVARQRRTPAPGVSSRARRASLAAGLALIALPVRAAGPASDPDAPRRGRSLPALEDAARARPDDPGVMLRLGLARAELGRRVEAARAFLAAALLAEDPPFAALAHYDLGVVRLDDGDLEGARDAFFDALALDPGDRRAQFNLEWTLRALAARTPTPKDDAKTEPAERRPPEGRPDPSARPPEAGRGEDETRGAGAEREGRPDEAAGEAPPAATRPGEGERPGAPGGHGGAERTGGDAANGATNGVPTLSADEVRRWLDAASDDPGRALRDTARRAPAPRTLPAPGAPAW